MDIFINGTRIDFTLEDEITVTDVIESLQENIKKDNGVISSIYIGDNCYSIGDEELSKYKIGDVKELKIEASTKEELAAMLLEECKKILTKIPDDIRENAFKHTSEIRKLFSWITETIETINSLALFSMIEAKLLISTVKQIDDYMDSSFKESSKTGPLSDIITNLISYIEAIQLKMSSDFTVTRESLLGSINEGFELLPEISASFQVGKDSDALAKINKIIGILELCGIYLRKNIDSFSDNDKNNIENLYNDINILLGKIAGAFENGDIVLLGDLLEYELPGKLADYKHIILGE